VSWKAAIESTDGPSALIFTRQSLPHQERDATQVANIAKGGYVLIEGSANADELDAVIIATGSEVSLAVDSAKALAEEGYHVRVVSMPATNVFDQQDAAYRESVLPAQVVNRVAVEAAHVDFWYKYVGLDGRVVGMTSFGESAPAEQLFEHFGITTAAVTEAVRGLLEDQLPA
jgi:transketolase